jgi:uncharacterized membrane protein YqjE
VAAKDSGPGAAPSPGLLVSLRNLASTLVAVVQTRLELLSTEVEEERLRLLQLLLVASFALFFSALGIIMLTGFVVVLFWDTHRVLVTVLFTILYLGIGLVLWLVVRDRAHRKSKVFSTSIAELAKDRQHLASTDVYRQTD